MSAVSTLTAPDAARMMREVARDGTWELYPMGEEVIAYLRWKRKRLTEGSDRQYTCTLAALALDHLDLELRDLEPPVGTTRIEEFLERRWGPDKAKPRTYNKHLSITKDFFKFQVARGNMAGDPTLTIERAKARDPHRETFNANQVRAIIAGQEELRDRIALRLLLNYALRKGELRAVQFKHFDHVRLRLMVFGKGGTVLPVPIPDPAFWHDLERHILDAQAEPGHYLMCGAHGHRYGSTPQPDTPMSNHRLHNWWYGCLGRSGIVAEGTTKGERMHKGRHTAGQALLDATGNLKAVQKLLRHKSMLTTADVYLDWDLDQLAQSLTEALERSE